MTALSPPAAGPRPPAARGGAGHGPAATWVRSHRGLVVLLLIPFVVFGIPRLFGLAFLTGDNLLQNFPLRVLVGQDLDHGVLPLWNPYLSSGTPLLGGFNAGAAYPATWLMAVLDAFTAWAVTLALAYDIALLGMYLFLRRQPITSTAATFGATTFAFAGYLTGQLVHVDLIEGAIWLPWMLLAVQGLTERPGSVPEAQPTPRPLRLWAGLLAVSLGACILSGGAEAIIDCAVVVAIFWVARLCSVGWHERRNRGHLPGSVGALVAGVAGGVALGAAQWLPGLAFTSQSQRAVPTYAFFTSGSLQERLLALVVSPFVLGTNQDWPGTYAGTYNFPEVTSYLGILALIAACSLFLRRWRTRPEARHWWVWYVVLVVGVLSALGFQTPFGHLLYLVPGLKSQRLLNRNLLLVDVALAVLLGWWSHLLITGRGDADPGSRPIRDHWRRGRRSEIVVPSIPFCISAVLCLSLWLDGPLLYRLLEAAVPVTTDTRLQVAGLVTVGTIIAGVATWVVLTERRHSAAGLARRLGAVLAVDLLVFNVFVIPPPIKEATAQAQGAASGAFRATVGDGRFIVYDPDQFESTQLYALGQTDLNIFTRLPSAQGYTALTDGDYYRATGAHLQEDLDPSTLAGPVWDGLNVTTLLSLPSYFVRPVPGTADGPTAPAGDVVPFPGTAAGDPAGRPVTVAADGVHRWYFGGALTVDELVVPVDRGGPPGIRIGLVTPSGPVRWLPARDLHATGPAGGSTLRVTLPGPTRAAGLVRAGPTTPVTVGVPTARTAEAGEVSLDGPLQVYVAPPHWTYRGTLGTFGVFHNSSARGWARLRAPGGAPAPSDSSVTAVAPGPAGGQRISVHAGSAVVLQRSEAWSPGWTATIQPVLSEGGSTGTPRRVPVLKAGIVQEVELPGPGDYLVTFAYAAHSALVGVAVSVVAAGILALWVVLEAVGVVRRRRAAAGRPPRTRPATGGRT